MITIYNRNNYLISKEIDPKNGYTLEWTTITPPEPINNKTLRFMGNKWVYLDNEQLRKNELVKSKEDKKHQINEIRYSKIYNSNISYTFPGDTEPDGIQMRNETDRQNIQDMVIDAMNKDPETIIYFMPVSNNLKAVSAQAIIDMGLYLKTRGDQIMGHSWQLKSQIEAADTLEALNEININEGWPEY
jgi:hypothetical protein